MGKEFPQKEKLIKTIENLSNIDFEKISYDKILSILLNEIKFIAIYRQVVPKTLQIFRGRLNDGYLFTKEEDISYNPISKMILNYGRFNKPYQQVFYGSMRLEEKDEHIVNTIYRELTDISNEANGNNMKLLTIGKWVVNKEFEIVTSFFNNTDISKEIKENPKKKEEINLIVDFYSKQITKANINNNHNNYKLTAAYAEYAFNQLKNCFGIEYRSIGNIELAHNIALLPFAVDNFLDLKDVKLFMVVKEKNKEPKAIELMYANELGNYNTSFNWKFKEENIDIIRNLF